MGYVVDHRNGPDPQPDADPDAVSSEEVEALRRASGLVLAGTAVSHVVGQEQEGDEDPAGLSIEASNEPLATEPTPLMIGVGPGGRPWTQGELVCGGRFRVERLLAKGATSTVYIATQERLQRRVALKVVDGCVDPDAAEALVHAEARAAVSVASSNIVRVLDRDEDSGCSLLVLELLQGETLSERMRAGKFLSRAVATAVVADVLAASAALHQAGFAHCDLCPDNVMLVPKAAEAGGFPLSAVLVDLAAAAHLQGARPATARVEKAAFAAPELLATGPIDARSDLYSIGRLFCFLLTGTPELPRPGAEPAEWSMGLGAWATRAVALEPKDRFEDAWTMRRALMELAGEAAAGALARPGRGSAEGQGGMAPGFEPAAQALLVPGMGIAQRPAEPEPLPVVVRARAPQPRTRGGSPRTKRWLGGRTARIRQRSGGGLRLVAIAAALCLGALWWSTDLRGQGVAHLCAVADCAALTHWGEQVAEGAVEEADQWLAHDWPALWQQYWSQYGPTQQQEP